VISTWTAAGADLDFALSLVRSGKIRSCRFVVDLSFPTRQPAYCAALRERFGDDCIRLTRSHAKFVVLTNSDWALCLRSSMNLNENRRLESWEISDDRGMADYLIRTIDTLFEQHSDGAQFDQGMYQNKQDFESFFGDDLNGRDVRRAGWTCQKNGKRIE
jgi:hypothetical protein